MVSGELRSLRITLQATDSGVSGHVYLRDIAPGTVARTVEVGPSIMADYSSDDELLGLEFLSAELADAEVMHQLASQLGAAELAGIDLAEMCKAPA